MEHQVPASRSLDALRESDPGRNRWWVTRVHLESLLVHDGEGVSSASASRFVDELVDEGFVEIRTYRGRRQYRLATRQAIMPEGWAMVARIVRATGIEGPPGCQPPKVIPLKEWKHELVRYLKGAEGGTT